MNRKHLPLVLTGILAGMSLALEVFVHFPILPAAPFLLYSPGDLPIIVASVAVALVNSVLFAMLTGEGGPWGAIMHFVASGGMALVIGYLAKRTGKLHIPMLAGVLTRVLLMIPLNLLITPIYTGTPRNIVAGMIVPVIVPFNLIHAGINTIISYALVKLLPKRTLASVGARNLA